MPKINLDEVRLGCEESWDQILAVHEALSRFAAIDQRASRVGELRFFAGLGLEEVAQVLSSLHAHSKARLGGCPSMALRRDGGLVVFLSPFSPFSPVIR